MKARLFPFIIALAALSVSCSAAFYSVYGLGKLFAGASTQVMIMAGSLEFAKLVIASALYQYWDSINKVLRAYLTLAIIVLMTITSAGIYGFLTGAYQETFASTQVVERQIGLIEAKKVNFQSRKDDYVTEKEQLTNSITQLRLAISNPGQSQYIDRKTGQVITNTSTGARTLLQAEVNKASADRDSLDTKIQALSDSIAIADMNIITIRNSDASVSELGPLMYLSKLTGVSMDRVINWYLLLIIFVFDPLAITLVVVANQAFDRLRIVNVQTGSIEQPIATLNDPPQNNDVYTNDHDDTYYENVYDQYESVQNNSTYPEPNIVTVVSSGSIDSGSIQKDIYQEKTNTPPRQRAYWT
jgi:hypothetical protein